MFIRDYLTIKLGEIPNIDKVYDKFKEFFILKDINKNNLIEVLKTIESYVFRRAVCGLPTNSLNKVFLKLLKKINKEDFVDFFKFSLFTPKDKTRFPNDEEFFSEFKTRDMYNFQKKQYMFEKLEHYDNKEIIDIDKNLSFEHIMPQKLSNEWKNDLGYNWKQIYDKYLHTIGNITLTGYNSTYKNKRFIEKLNIPKGFKESNLKLNSKIKLLNHWGESEIIQRSENLGKEALNIWKYKDDDSNIFNKFKKENDDLIMKTYSPKERLNDLDLPNLFNYATKELSQDAFLCWALEWINIRGHQMCEFAYLLLESFIKESIYKNQIDTLDIDKVEIKKQYKNIDILVLAKLRNGLILPIIIEDKTDTSEHDNQLDRYRETIIKEYTDFPEPICIYYKTGYIFEPYPEIEKHHYIVYNKMKILNIMKVFEDYEMPLLFCDYYLHLFTKKKYENDIISAYDRAVQCGNISILIETLNIDFAQWELMKKLMTNIKSNADKIFIRGKNPSGSPWTIYYIDDRYLKRNDEAFYRVDRNKDGYYLSLRQYLKYDTAEFMKKEGINDKDILFQDKMKRLDIYRECFEKSVRELRACP